MTRKIIIDHEGATYSGELGVVEKTELGYQDHGILTASLVIEGDGISVVFGGYRLDQRGEGSAFGLDHIIQIMHTLGAEKWEDLRGKQVIALFEGAGPTLGKQIKGIASTLHADRVFIPAEHAAQWLDRGGQEAGR